MAPAVTAIRARHKNLDCTTCWFKVSRDNETKCIELMAIFSALKIGRSLMERHSTLYRGVMLDDA